MSDLIHRAQEFATQAHTRIDHRRKYTNAPYVDHLSATAKLVASVTKDAAAIAAAWLHDTVEDTPVTLLDIEREFGAEVASIVSDLTDVSKPGDGNRAARKAIDLAHLGKSTPRAKTVKLADLINNCVDISSHDARFARTYMAEMEALLEVLTEGDARLLELARKTVIRSSVKLGRKSLLPETPQSASPVPSFGAVSSLIPRLFVDAFTAKDIASPLLSFDSIVPSAEVLARMQLDGLTVVGVREAGRTIGYVIDEDLGGKLCGEHVRSFGRGQLIHSEGMLVDLIAILTRQSHCFVTMFDDVAALVSRSDMNKPVVRMWLFGLITIVEMHLTELIVSQHVDDDWQSLLSRGRLEKALSLYKERGRRGVRCDLVDCLQLSDKADVLRKDATFKESFGFSSSGQVRQVTKELESLRNSLAHGVDIVSNDWAQIARLARLVEGIIQANK